MQRHKRLVCPAVVLFVPASEKVTWLETRVIQPWSNTLVKARFHMSGKSQTIWDFTVSRPSQIMTTNENWKMYWHSWCVGWLEINQEHQKCFYYPDASQISGMVGDHSRHMKTQICTVQDVGNSFNLLPILYIALLQSLPLN